MRSIKNLVNNWMPPILLCWFHRLRKTEGICFKGDFSTWQEASVQCTGYDTVEILAKVLAATLKVKHGEAAFERDSVLFDQSEYAWPVLSGLMLAAARNGGRLNVLDFGGALGSSYFQNIKFLQSLPEVIWNVVEQSHYVDAGRANIQDEELRFYKSIDECLTENKPNVILLSSVVQYLEGPINFIGELNRVGAMILIFDRTPFSLNTKDKLVIQKVPASIYTASYPMWIFSMSKFTEVLIDNWTVLASNSSPEGYMFTKNKDEFSFQGMLLESKR